MIETGYERILGTPSMQAILEFLSVYDVISIKELKTFTGFSVRTIHDNLKVLKDQGIVIQSKRGVYKLADSRAFQLLANFYEQIVIEQVGNMLQDITEKINKGKTKKQLDVDLKKLEHLLDHWKPIFEKYFPSAIPTIFLSLRNR